MSKALSGFIACALAGGVIAAGCGGDDDTTSAISVEAMIERAIRLLERPSSPLIVMLDGGAQSA